MDLQGGSEWQSPIGYEVVKLPGERGPPCEYRDALRTTKDLGQILPPENSTPETRVSAGGCRGGLRRKKCS